MLVLCSWTPGVLAQPPLQAGGVSGPASNGFHIYNATASAGYSSLIDSMQFNNSVIGLGGDYSSWVSMNLGYSRTGSKDRLAILYVPSYSGTFGFSTHPAFNQDLEIEFTRRFNAKWALHFAGTGADNTVNQFLFNASPLSQIVNRDAGFAELAGNLMEGDIAATATPSQLLIYGTRVLTVGAQSGLDYKPTSRLRMHFNGIVSQSQALSDHSQPQTQFLVARSRYEQGNVSIFYALSPLTDVGLQASTSRTSSTNGDYQSSIFEGSLGRKFGPHVFATGSAGLGFFTPIGTGRAVHEATYVANAALGYKARAQTFAVTYARFTSDVFGLGSSVTSGFSGAWNWKRLDKNWGLYAFGSKQGLSGGYLGNVSVWQASAGFTRTLGRQVSLSIAYSYMVDSLAVQTYTGASARAIRLTVSWIPFLRDTAPLSDRNTGATTVQ